MSVDKRIREDAEALTREVSVIDSEAILSGAFAAVHAVGSPHDSTEVPACPDTAGRASAPRRYLGTPETWPDDELAACLRRAEEGDAASARRVAELLEVKNQSGAAVVWWRQAAVAGDPDAILYVQDFSDS